MIVTHLAVSTSGVGNCFRPRATFGFYLCLAGQIQVKYAFSKLEMEPSRALLIAYYYCLLMGTNKVISRLTRGVVVYHSVSQPFGLQVPAEDKFSHHCPPNNSTICLCGETSVKNGENLILFDFNPV